MPITRNTSVVLASMHLQTLAVMGCLPAISFIPVRVFGLWDRIPARIAARDMRKARIESMRHESLAGVGAWGSGEKAVSTAPVMLIRPPDSRGHCAVAQWPRHAERA